MYNSIPPYEDFVKAHEANRVSMNVHDNYALFKYKTEVQYARDWDEVTINARGIIFDQLTKECVVLPFKKFFNLGETGCELSVMPSDPNYELLEKMDGSMGCVFLDREGELRVATPGSLVSDQAIWATKWLRGYDKYENIKKMFTESNVKALVAEIICPISKVVVPYDFEGLVLIAGQLREKAYVNRDSVKYARWDVLAGIAESVGLRVCREFMFGSLKDVQGHLDEVEDFEGFVLHWPETGFRIKMKAEDYKRRHRILSSIHPNRINEAILSKKHKDLEEVIKSVDEAIVQFPEEYVTPYENAVQEWATGVIRTRIDIYRIVKDFEDKTPKELALWLKDATVDNGKWFNDTYFSHIMNDFNGRLDINKFALTVWEQVREKHFGLEKENE